jgi:hypothetical protein
MRKDYIPSIGLLLIAAIYYFSSVGIPESSLDEAGVPGPKSLPTVLAGLLAIIAMTLGVRALASSPARGGPKEEKEDEAPWPRALGMLLIAVLYLPVASFLGYPIAIFLLLIMVALYERKVPDWRLLAVAAGGALFFWFVFAFMLGVRQPEGIFGF